MRSRPGAVLSTLVLLVGLAAAGCTDEDDAGDGNDGGAGVLGGIDTTVEPGEAGPATPLQLRPVTADEDAPTTELDDVDCDSPTTTAADQPTSGCDAEGNRYLLGPADLEGTADEAEAVTDPGSGEWVVSVVLSGEAADRLAEVSATYAGTQQRVAVVVEGEVVSAPVFAGPIEGGELQIAGPDVTEDEARAVAAALD